jgi:hypothetical protein
MEKIKEENEFMVKYNNKQIAEKVMCKINNIHLSLKEKLFTIIDDLFGLNNKSIGYHKMSEFISSYIGIKGKSRSDNCEKYWILRGWSREEIINLSLLRKRKGKDKSPMCVEFWMKKGMTEKESKLQIKSQRKCNIEYWIKKGYTNEEALEKISRFQTKNSEKLKDLWQDNEYRKNHTKNSKLFIEYWLNKGYTEEEAKLKLIERQTTFSKEICIEKYGEEEGLKKWQERQDKWQQTLNDKPIEEKERINRAKMGTKSYSEISQTLFWWLNELIKNKYKRIYFAQKDKNGNKVDNNNEYAVIINEDGKMRFLDFYVEDTNKCIEFDGDYWHDLETVGNVERDTIRETEIINAMTGIQIMHVKEKDYRETPFKVVEKCLEFLNG